MVEIPAEVREEWNRRDGPAVFTTVNEDHEPNSVYVSCIKMRNKEKFVIADNHFDKTKTNIFSGSYGAVLFITDENKSYQLKGPLQYETEGEIYRYMKTWLDPDFPGHGATVLEVEEVYQGSDRLA